MTTSERLAQLEAEIQDLRNNTVEGAYERPMEEIAPPHGWEFTAEFRNPMPGEWFYALSYEGAQFPMQATVEYPFRRLILRSTQTVESIYGKPLSEIKPPAGWAFTGEFRVPHVGEPVMLRDGHAHRVVKSPPYTPSLILRPAKRLVLDVVAEDRAPRKGEWFYDPGDEGIEMAIWDYKDEDPCRYVLSSPRIEESK